MCHTCLLIKKNKKNPTHRIMLRVPHCPPQSSSVLTQERWLTVHALCAPRRVLQSGQSSVSPATRVTSWKVPAWSPAMAETRAPRNGVTAARSVCVSSFFSLFLLLIAAHVQMNCKHVTVLLFSSRPISEIWPMSKPWRPWQWLPDLVQAQLPGRGDAALLLLRGLRTYWRGHHQLCSRSSLSVEQPTTLLQRWRLCRQNISHLLIWSFSFTESMFEIRRLSSAALFLGYRISWSLF